MENAIPKEVTLRRKIYWPRLAYGLGIFFLIALAAWMIISLYVTGPLAQSRQARAQAIFEAETGIRIVWVAIAAGGGMVDLRYQILDPDKSLIVHDDDNPPTLIDEATGQILATPFHEHGFDLLQTGVTYSELFVNGGGVLERGDTITITVGDARLEQIMVQ